MTGTEGSASQECLEKREPHTPRNNLEYIPAGANLQEAHKRGWKVGNQQANHPEGSVCVWAGGGGGQRKILTMERHGQIVRSASWKRSPAGGSSVENKFVEAAKT